MKNRNTILLFTAILIVLLGCIAYSNSFDVPFQYDGHRFIKENPNIRTLKGVFHLATLFNRSVFYLSLALNYALGRLDVTGYHAVNLIIHLINSLLVFMLVRQTLSLPSVSDRYRKYANSLAAGTALLFAVNPVQTEAVTYVYQRSTSLVALFFILALWLYSKGRTAEKCGTQNAYLILCGVVVLLALMTKANSAMLPAFIMLYEFVFIQNLSVKRVKTFLIVGAILWVIFMAVYPHIISTGKDLGEAWSEHYETRYFSPVERFTTEWRVIIYYVTLIVFPHPSRLRLDYDFEIARSLTDHWATIPSGLFLAALFFFAVWLMKRDKIISFAILWYMGNLAVESTFAPLMIAFEHRIYLPSVFVFLLIVIGLKSLGDHLRKGTVSDTGLKNILLRKENAVLVIILFIWTGWTYQRNEVWRSEETLWADTLEKSPNRPKPHVYMGKVLYSKAGRAEGAEQNELMERSIRHSKRAVELNPQPFAPYVNLGLAYGKMGLNDRSAEAFKAALERNPREARSLEGLGIIYGKQGRLRKAEEFIKKAMEVKPGIANHHNSLGIVYALMGRTDDAIEQFETALELYPEYGKAHSNLARAYYEKGDRKKFSEHRKLARKYSGKSDTDLETVPAVPRKQD